MMSSPITHDVLTALAVLPGSDCAQSVMVASVNVTQGALQRPGGMWLTVTSVIF